MEYSAPEKQALSILGRTDFKSIKKDEILSIGGYGKAIRYCAPLSTYEILVQRIADYEEQIHHLQEENQAYEDLFNGK